MVNKILMFLGIYLLSFGFLFYIKIASIIQMEDEAGEEFYEITPWLYVTLALTSIPVAVFFYQLITFFYSLYSSGILVILIIAIVFIGIKAIIWSFN